jgi:hypothetical protein
MKKIITIILATFLLTNFSIAQNLVNAFTKQGKVFVQNDNGNAKQIVSEGENTVVGFSKSKNIVLFERLEQKSKTEGQEGEESYDQVSIRCFNLTSNKETTLFTTCLDGNGGTKPDYASSSIYPNDYLCGFESYFLSNDGERLFFQTNGWATCPAIHYYNLNTNKLVFFKAGWLQKVQTDGVVVQITGIETKNNQGKIESKGRYVQTCLFDMNGNLLKELTAKEF